MEAMLDPNAKPFSYVKANITINNKQDPSIVSQFLTYRLFNQVGVQAPRVGFARVTVNGTYLGVYSNVESVEKPFQGYEPTNRVVLRLG